MIVKCEKCNKYFDDEFRDTTCPHGTFLANNGRNHFKHYREAWLEDHEPGLWEHGKYSAWLRANKVATD